MHSEQAIDKVRGLFQSAAVQFSDGDLVSAEVNCSKVLEIDPGHPLALHMAGLIAREKGDTALALNHLSKAVTVAPNNADAHLSLGEVLYARGLRGKAAEHFSLALALDQDIANGHLNLGVTLKQLGRHDDAVQVLQEGLEKYPDDEYMANVLATMTVGDGIYFTKVRVEATNACKYKCDMCPREKMSRKTGIMPPEDYRFFLERFKEYVEEAKLPQPYGGTFFLHGFGESLMDPLLAEKSAMVAEQFPESCSLIISTLGVRRPESYLRDLLEKGKLKSVIVSMYGFQERTYLDVHQEGDFKAARDNITRLAELNAALGGPCDIALQILSPHTEDVMRDDPAEQRAFDDLMAILRPLGVTLDKLHLHNFGDGRGYFDPQANTAVCSVVDGRRREHLNVTWDLKVLPCCLDYNAEMILGDLHKQSIAEIYRSETYKKFIDAHRSGNLDDYPTCKGCNVR